MVCLIATMIVSPAHGQARTLEGVERRLAEVRKNEAIKQQLQEALIDSLARADTVTISNLKGWTAKTMALRGKEIEKLTRVAKVGAWYYADEHPSPPDGKQGFDMKMTVDGKSLGAYGNNSPSMTRDWSGREVLIMPDLPFIRTLYESFGLEPVIESEPQSDGTNDKGRK